ncbi:gamma-butyrobetaine hydroxylase-like domain-containing protein, partial [Pseudomonas aeruginosa]
MTQPPLRLRNSARDGWLMLEWADGAVSRIDHARLRAACPCAQCRAQRLRGRIVAA